jgi:hypothetical protein
VFPYGVQVKAIIAAISSLRATVSDAADDEGLFDASGRYIVAPSDSNSVAFSRNTSQVCPAFLLHSRQLPFFAYALLSWLPLDALQVLSIVYLGGSGSGGFFPNGLNGAIH